jgi:hypothetical protein
MFTYLDTKRIAWNTAKNSIRRLYAVCSGHNDPTETSHKLATPYGNFSGCISIITIINKLTPRSIVLPEKLTGSQLVKKLSHFMELSAFIETRHLSLSWPRSIQSKPPHHTMILFNIILPSMSMSSPSGLLPLRSPHQNPECTSLLPHTCYMLHPCHSSRFRYPNDIWWGVQSIKLLVT